MSVIPTEVELVFEVMPCNALRTAQQPGQAPHPCSYFRKWGTYHSYDYQTAGAPQTPGIEQQSSYLGRAPLIPEMLSGCRKAPIMAVGINPNLPGWWTGTRNSINPLFDDFRQFAHYFRYREIAKLDIPRAAYQQFGGGPQDTPFSQFELNVPVGAGGERTIPTELHPMTMYQNYQLLLDDLAREVGWNGHRLNVGEDLSYGNMVACPSAKWINRPDPDDPAMPPMTRTEQTGIVSECFHHRRYFLRQLFQSLPAVLLIFSQSTADAFLGEMQGHFFQGDPRPGDRIDALLNQELRLLLATDSQGRKIGPRVIFSPHITGNPGSFNQARARVLAQLVDEARSGKITLNAATGHLKRPVGTCTFCTHLEIGPCDYESELVPVADPVLHPVDQPAADKLIQKKRLEAFLGDRGRIREPLVTESALRSPGPAEPPPSESRTPMTKSGEIGWNMAGDPARAARVNDAGEPIEETLGDSKASCVKA